MLITQSCTSLANSQTYDAELLRRQSEQTRLEEEEEEEEEECSAGIQYEPDGWKKKNVEEYCFVRRLHLT